MMFRKTITDILDDIELPDRLFPRSHWRVLEKGHGWLLQLIFEAENSETGESEEQRCRKWYVSVHSTRTEVLRTAHKACHAAIEHELDEFFVYKGRRIFSPHRDVTDLTGIVGVDIRKPNPDEEQ